MPLTLLQKGPIMPLTHNRIFSILWACVFFGLFVWSSSASAWWNDDWSMRKKITLDTSPTGGNITEPINGMTVLIRLHAGNFRFGQAKDDASDLRFVAGDDKTPLKFHIEHYDPLLAEGLAWVYLPDLKPGSKEDIWLYYGNKKAVAAGDSKGSYDADTLLDYHFAEKGAPAQDSSVWANHAQSVGVTAEGSIVGTGIRLDGTSRFTLPASPSLAIPDNAAETWSAWIKPASLQRNAVIYSRRDGPSALLIGIDDGAPFVEVTNNGTVQRSAAGAPVAPNGWHHLALSATPGLVTLYLDGASYATLNATLPALNSTALLGGDSAPPAASLPPADTSSASSASPPGADAQAAAGGAQAPAGDAQIPASAQAPAGPAYTGFAGDLDELEIAKVARSAGYIKAAAEEQGADHAKFVTYSVDEETASWFSGYFAVILKSVTLDGWVVIGILVFMAVVSWVVMIDKAMFVGRQRKANVRFMRIYGQLTTSVAMAENDEVDKLEKESGLLAPQMQKALRHSSLYRLYRVGQEELGFLMTGYQRGGILTAQAIAALRAELDAGFAIESQKLNRLMVLLTIAISGGPFLGLLGTVVGVMITFAAIAASGDVNVNAIAPGIAAALVATVAGLGVAIPALFGYNYLITQIKDLSTDMQVFVDKFTTRTAARYAIHSPQRQQSLAAE
jgi:biopolymer transport protein ExbB